MLRDPKVVFVAMSPVGSHLHGLAILNIGESQAMGARQEQIQHRPAQAQATRLTGESTNDFSPAAHLL